MSLTDFLDFDPFNQLRDKMNASSLGRFELFDPKWHLTGGERSLLDREGVSVPARDICMLLDFTLVYKNSRVLLEDTLYFHIANCEQLSIQNMCTVSTSLRGLSGTITVCPACLQRLGFEGYDMEKARREAYSRRVLDGFQLNKYWKQYPMYPVSEKREKRKPIGGSLFSGSFQDLTSVTK